MAKSLSHDEKKAAEAAFLGQPSDALWSDSAHMIYAGLMAAIAKRDLKLIEEDIGAMVQ
jgi:hypothetical protein